MADANSHNSWQAVRIKTVSGTIASTDNTVIAAVADKVIKVIGYSLTTVTTTETTVVFEDGAGGTELWRATLDAPATAGERLFAGGQYHIFATTAGNLLNITLGATQTIHYSISYYEDDN